MAIALDDHTRANDEPVQVAAAPRAPWMAVAAASSVGAGVVHAAAAGAHSEHPATVVAFTAVAAAQVTWGVTVTGRDTQLLRRVGIIFGLAAFASWITAKTAGIAFIAGLERAEPLQVADGVAAALAVASVMAIALASLRRGGPSADVRIAVAVSVAAAVILAAVGVAQAGEHLHGGATDGTAVEAGSHGHQRADAARPYDPSQPIDLGGVPGVTPRQQAAAENLVAVTLLRLPQWSDSAVAEAAGFRSIGDGFTGHEHLVNQAFMDDDVLLDPDRPESLVYDTTRGGRRLVAAMYMLKRGTPLDQAPDIGGDLMQWHIHDNLCYNAAGKVAGLTDASGACPPGLFKPVPTPMIHVWIQPHKCGPFAALEGIAGGTVPEGQAVLCDRAHGG